MTTYVVSYLFNRRGHLHTFRCTASDPKDALEQCLAFNPGALVHGVFTEEELINH